MTETENNITPSEVDELQNSAQSSPLDEPAQPSQVLGEQGSTQLGQLDEPAQLGWEAEAQELSRLRGEWDGLQAELERVKGERAMAWDEFLEISDCVFDSSKT